MIINTVVSFVNRQKVALVVALSVAAIVIWYFAGKKIPRRVHAALCALYIAAVLYTTVVHRVVYGVEFKRVFVVFNAYTGDFYRELIFNAVLFLPLGMTLPFAIKSYIPAVFAGFAVSVVIEALQYAFAVGTTQVSDVIFNTLGTAVGGISYLLAVRLRKHEE